MLLLIVGILFLPVRPAVLAQVAIGRIVGDLSPVIFGAPLPLARGETANNLFWMKAVRKKFLLTMGADSFFHTQSLAGLGAIGVE
jgi:hypothetical protein